MNKALLWIVVLLAVGVGGFYYFNNYIYEEKQAYATDDFMDAEYVIDGERVQLKDGVSERDTAPGSATKVITRFFGNDVTTDLDGDGREDIAFLLTQEMGGSGTFFYVVAALNTERGYIGSSAFLLGDRIAPQTTEVSRDPSHQRVIVVNYADRAPGEPMTTQPSQGKSVWLKLDPATMQFGEVVQGFEGEVDISKMTLDMKAWEWLRAVYEDSVVEPKVKGKFAITFAKDGTFSATTDCNRMSGSYTEKDGSLSFGPIAMTKMYCEGSQESDFAKVLENAEGYEFISSGALLIDLKGGGSAVFR